MARRLSAAPITISFRLWDSVRQTYRVAFFADIGLHFGQAVSGDLSRQQETGQRVLASQPEPASLRIDPRLNEVDNEGQIAALLPILCEQDADFAERVKAGRSDSKQYQKVIQAVFNAWVSPDCPQARQHRVLAGLPRGCSGRLGGGDGAG